MSDASRSLRALIRANTPHALRRYLRGLAEVAVLGGSLAAAGCASSHFPPESELTEPACAEGRWRAAQGLSPAAEVDYLGVYSADGMVLEAFELDATGAACSGATDAAACDAAMTALHGETWGRYVVTTAGDDVGQHRSEEELLALLGPIDTPGEALLRAWHAGYDVRCADASRAGVREVAGGYEVVATQARGGCGDPLIVTRYLLMVGDDGTVAVLEQEEVERIDDPGCAGRRPAGLAPARGPVGEDAVGRWLASIARLEASAVHAFDTLARELEAHGAPDELVARARAAADDEVRHAALMTEQASRFGAAPLACEVAAPSAPRGLFEIALENAVEGCVRETYGALVAHHQALAASDPALGRTMRVVAEDESRHAELSWAVAAWIEPRLSAAERAELAFARARAVSELRAEMGLAPEPALRDLAGLPDAAVAVALLDELVDTLL